MSGGSKDQTSTTDLPDWMKPYGSDFLNRASAVSQKPYTPYSGQTVAGLDPLTQQGIDQTGQLGTQGTAAGNAGTQALTDTLGGKYLDQGNPYLSGIIDQAQGDVVRNYNQVVKPQTEAAMVNSGSFGNAGLQQYQQGQQSDLQRNLGDISTNIRGNAYANERGLMNSAIGLAPTYNAMQFGNANAATAAGQLRQQQEQAQLSDLYQRFLQEQGWDASQLGVLGNALGTLSGRQTTVSGPQGISGGQGALAGATAGSAFGPWGTGIGAGLGYLASRGG
jgi:hypothetical protein